MNFPTDRQIPPTGAALVGTHSPPQEALRGRRQERIPESRVNRSYATDRSEPPDSA